MKSIFRTLSWCAGITILLTATCALADSNTVVAHAQRFAVHYSAYARVEPITIVKLNASQTGVVTGMNVLPGDSVKSGTVLGHLTGPEVDGLLSQRSAEVDSASAAVTAAEKILGIERRKLAAHLGTQKAVDQAEADLTVAKARFGNASSQLKAAQSSLVLEAPADGTVLAINAAEGEKVRAGQTILTVQPAGGLWLIAYYYGPDAAAIRVGMTGKFEPADGRAAIPVRVRTIIGPVGKDGGFRIGLIATLPSPRWLNGEAGGVTLEGANRTYVAVPTRALILDHGRWWVLVHTPKGDLPRSVVPGPSRGSWTLIETGIDPGTEVVVENAYLKFHKNVSRHYLPPY